MTKSEFETLALPRRRDCAGLGFFPHWQPGICAASAPPFRATSPRPSKPTCIRATIRKRGGQLPRRIGQRSKFFNQHGYYLDCVDPGLATLPDGWTERLIPFRTPRTGGVTAWCLDPHDLFAAKLAAWRVKDQLFLAAMLRHKFARPAVVKNRVAELPVSAAHKREMLAALEQLVAENRRALRAKKK